jgi:BMFP domain-containing protein YqiC
MMKPSIPPQFQTLFTDAQAAFDKLVAAAPIQEAKASADALMQQALAKMGAVPRADFDIQRDMLIALRERVALLEAQLAEFSAKKD